VKLLDFFTTSSSHMSSTNSCVYSCISMGFSFSQP
jgi:hypothetical protein